MSTFEDPKIKKLLKKADKDDQIQLENKIKSLTIQDRLLRRLKNRTVNISFKDDLSDFTIECRLLSPKEQRELINIRTKLTTLLFKLNDLPTDEKESKKLIDEHYRVFDEIYNRVGDICVDETLNYDYWKKGEKQNSDVVFHILAEVQRLSSQEGEDIKFFRGVK